MKYDKWSERYLKLAKQISEWSLDPSTKETYNHFSDF